LIYRFSGFVSSRSASLALLGLATSTIAMVNPACTAGTTSPPADIAEDDIEDSLTTNGMLVRLKGTSGKCLTANPTTRTLSLQPCVAWNDNQIAKIGIHAVTTQNVVRHYNTVSFDKSSSQRLYLSKTGNLEALSNPNSQSVWLAVGDQIRTSDGLKGRPLALVDHGTSIAFEKPSSISPPLLKWIRASVRVPLSYWDATRAIETYPKFGATRPEIMADLYPNGGGRNYPITDAHVHNSFTDAWADIKSRAGIYSANDVIISKKNSAGLTNGNGLGNENLDAHMANYPSPDVKTVNLSDLIEPWRQDVTDSVPSILAKMSDYYKRGAGGFKVYLTYDYKYEPDDPRLSAVWDLCAQYKWPVLFHVNGSNKVPGFLRLVAAHPKTIFQAPHMLTLVDAILPENTDDQNDALASANLAQLTTYLQTYPNLYIDPSARTENLARVRNQSLVKSFFIKNQDKILFGTDAGYTSDATQQTADLNVSRYRDELMYFETTQYAHLFWWSGHTNGLGLPADVLAKLYYKNYLKVYYHASNPTSAAATTQRLAPRALGANKFANPEFAVGAMSPPVEPLACPSSGAD
jgi:hypothetical protein